MEQARGECERERQEFEAALQLSGRIAAEQRDAFNAMQDALAAYKTAAADVCGDLDEVASLQQQYLDAKAVFAARSIELEAARRVAETEKEEFECAKSFKEKEELDLQEAAAALQREVEEASHAAEAFEQVFSLPPETQLC